MQQTVQFPDVQRRFFDKCLPIRARDAPPAFTHMNRLLSGLCSPEGIRQSRSGLGVYMISGDGSSVTIGRRYGYLILASEELVEYFGLPPCEFVFFLTDSKTVSQSFNARFIFVGYPIVVQKRGGLDVTRVCVRSLIDVKDNCQVVQDPDEVLRIFLQFEKQGKVKDDNCRVSKTSCRRKKVTKSETTESPEESAQDTTCGQSSSKQESEGSPDNCEVKVEHLHSHQEFSCSCADEKKEDSVQDLPPFSDETMNEGSQQLPEGPLGCEDNSFEDNYYETPLYLDGEDFGSFYPSNTSDEFLPSESSLDESPFTPDQQYEILF